MSGHHIARYGHQRSLSRGHSKDFTVATPEEFVKRFGGDRVINKVYLQHQRALVHLALDFITQDYAKCSVLCIRGVFLHSFETA